MDPSTPGPAASLDGLDSVALLDPRHRELLAGAACGEILEAGASVYQEGSAGRDFLVVVEGELEARRDTPMGVQRVATLGPGNLVGEISLLDGGPRSSSVVAVRRSRVCRFDGTKVAALAGGCPDLDAALLRTFCRSLAAKIREANLVMTQIMAPGCGQTVEGRGSQGEQRAMDEDAKRRLLHEQGLRSDELQKLSQHLQAAHYPGGAPIFTEGEPGDTLYIVADGRVRISRRIPGMGEEALAILERGEVFGELAWIDTSPRSADAIAHGGGATVVAIHRDHLNGTIDSSAAASAEFLRVLCRVLCRRVRAMNDQLVAYRTMAWFE